MKYLLFCSVVLVAARLSKAKSWNAELSESQSAQDRIYNGFNTTGDRFPFQVLIVLKSLTNVNVNICGGSTLSDTYVLSAAQCFKKGEWTGATLTFGIGLKRYVTEVVPNQVTLHPDFADSPTLIHDLAIIKLIVPVPFELYGGALGPLFLPNMTGNGGDGENPDIFAGKLAVISGYGRTNDSATFTLPLAVQYHNSYIMSLASCQEYYSANTDHIITNAHICTNTTFPPPGGPCTGDTGGPLILRVFRPGGRDTYQLGVYSFSDGEILPDGTVACSNQNPSVYTNVAYHLSWIKSITGL